MSGPALSFVNWFAAALPLAVMLALMVRFRWGGARAGPAGAVAALFVAALLFGAGPRVLAIASWKGVILSFHVLYIIWPALILYHVVDGAGAIRSIGAGVATLTEDHILQLLILGFAFSTSPHKSAVLCSHVLSYKYLKMKVCKEYEPKQLTFSSYILTDYSTWL